MPSLARGESSTQGDPVLDLWTAVGNPAVLTDVALLRFRVYDISTPAKRGTPVQVHPGTLGDWEDLDPVNDAPTGHRLGTGHNYAPYTVPLDEAIGDHKIVWEFQHSAVSPWETLSEEFYVAEGTIPTADTYCGVSCLRAEGYTDPPFTDARIDMLIALATRYIDKVTGRWFTPRTFDDSGRFRADGKDSRTLHLEVPIIRLDKLYIENQGLVSGDLTEIDLDAVRVYNRHVSGMTQPDDRENPKLSFIQTRAMQIHAEGLFPAPRVFPLGRLNVQIEGVFGYTDPDGSPFGCTPLLIQQVCCRLVARDLLLDSDACEKLNVKQKYRIISDKEGSTTVKLQNLWLKGAFTGDPEIDNVLMAFKRPPRMAAV